MRAIPVYFRRIEEHTLKTKTICLDTIQEIDGEETPGMEAAATEGVAVTEEAVGEVVVDSEEDP